LRRAFSIEIVSIPYQSNGYRAKKLLLGPPLKTSQFVHERISKRVALAVFSSDPISSTAYATEEMLLVLVLAGTAATGLALIAAGVWRLVTGDLEPIRYTPEEAGLLHSEGAVGAVTVLLILRAFASGTTALTGVEAISNGVSAFRAPEAVNAKTLMVMAVIMGVLFLGITYLAVRLEALPFESGCPTVISRPDRGLPGRHPCADPAVRGRGGDLLHPGPGGHDPPHLRLREPGWRGGVLINGVGASVTMVALVVIIVGKLAEGAWMVVIAIPLVWLLLRIQRTYGRELAPPKPRHEVVVLTEDLDQAPSAPSSTPASSTRSASPPCTSPSTPTTPASWAGSGRRSTFRPRWS
jgi:hypothetical protein